MVVEPRQPNRRRVERVEPKFHWNADPEPEVYVVFGSEEEDWDRDLPSFKQGRQVKRGNKVGSTS